MASSHILGTYLRKYLSHGLKNWYFLLSQFLFLCLFFTGTSISALAINVLSAVLAVIATCGILTYTSFDILAFIKKAKPVCKLLALLSACSICYYGASTLYHLYLPARLLSSVAARLSLTSSSVLIVFSFVGAIGGFFSAFFAFLFIFDYLASTLQKRNPFSGLISAERWLYLALLIAFCLYSGIVFSKSDCFYSSGFNKIYSLDCGIIMDNPTGGIAYINPVHPQNYIHQPLFAAFTAPFACIPYALSLLFPHTTYASALFMNIAQLLLLFTANLMLARLLKLSSSQRIIFMLLCCAMYDTLLFSIAMEQYISSIFWAILFLYLSQEYPPRLFCLHRCHRLHSYKRYSSSLYHYPLCT